MLLMLLSLGACAVEPSPVPDKTKRVLIVTGEDYKGHKWLQTTPVLKAMLDVDSRLAVQVTQDLATLKEEQVHDFDVLVMHFKNYDASMPGREGFDNLARFVERGGGLVMVHFSCGAFQEFLPDFTALAGRVWDPARRGHDPLGRFTVEMVDPEHPITRGLDDFETIDELYTCLVGETPIRVLAESQSKVDGKRYPLAFVLDYGKGRVFHTVLGHNVVAYKTPGTAGLIRRGTLWAARAAVDTQVSKTQASKTQASK